MCFLAPYSLCKLQQAKEDIIVYKVISDPIYKRCFWKPWKKQLVTVSSYYENYPYQIGCKNLDIDIAKTRFTFLQEPESFGVSKGYHSFDSFKKALRDLSKCTYVSYIIECLIPKGSFFFHYDGFYVSSNIIITNKIHGYNWSYFSKTSACT